MARIEQQRKSRVIRLLHRRETTSFTGFPLMRYGGLHDGAAGHGR